MMTWSANELMASGSDGQAHVQRLSQTADDGRRVVELTPSARYRCSEGL